VVLLHRQNELQRSLGCKSRTRQGASNDRAVRLAVFDTLLKDLANVTSGSLEVGMALGDFVDELWKPGKTAALTFCIE
jgi:hypothetical protein